MFPVVSAGTYKLALINKSIGPHSYVAVGGLPEDITVNEFIEVLDAVDAGAPPPEGAFGAGASLLKAGEGAPGAVRPHGPWAVRFFCPIPTPDGTPHYRLGFVGLFDVVAG